MSNVPAVVDRNLTSRHEFGANSIQNSAETAVAAVAAREEAKIKAMYVMAERNPRPSWDTIRVRLMSHCDRPSFAEIALYEKPVGKKQVNGEWVEQFAIGLSARFAEMARQEMGNVSTESSVVYEDDLIRIVRASVVDVQRNSHDSREITIAKAIEKRGKKKGDKWIPPDGREVLSERINSYGDPVYLVRATEDEIRNRQNSEISKAQRDESLRLIPKDIRDDCEEKIRATLDDPAKVDPATARKKLIDAFAKLSVIPEDLVTYMGAPLDRLSPAQVQELRGLHGAIKDGEIDFQSALRRKYETPDGVDVADSKADLERIIRDKSQPTKTRRAASEKLTATPEDEPLPFSIENCIEKFGVLKDRLKAAAGVSAGEAEYYRILKAHGVLKSNQFRSAEKATPCYIEMLESVKQIEALAGDGGQP